MTSYIYKITNLINNKTYAGKFINKPPSQLRKIVKEYPNYRYLDEYLISSKQLETLPDENVNTRRKPIKQFTKEGIFINNWKSLTHAAMSTNTSAATLCQHLKGNLKHANNFLWQYA